jgi:hypothetical protein
MGEIYFLTTKSTKNTKGMQIEIFIFETIIWFVFLADKAFDFYFGMLTKVKNESKPQASSLQVI